MNAECRVLVADDDGAMRNLIQLVLSEAGFEVLLAQDGLRALELWREKSPDLILLDVVMPPPDGFEVCRVIRKASNVPVIFLTARKEEQDVVTGFEAGAYDFVVKPFRPRELVARLRAVLQRRAEEHSRAGAGNIFIYEGLELDLGAQQVRLKGQAIPVSPIGFKLLLYFLQHPGEILAKETLLEQVWGYPDVNGDLNLVETGIKRLRKEIGDNPKQPKYVRTVWGIGYRFGVS